MNAFVGIRNGVLIEIVAGVAIYGACHAHPAKAMDR